jgi:hypothetical protein
MNRFAIAAALLLAVGTMQEAVAAFVWLLGNDLERNCSTGQGYFRYGVCAGYVIGVAVC